MQGEKQQLAHVEKEHAQDWILGRGESLGHPTTLFQPSQGLKLKGFKSAILFWLKLLLNSLSIWNA